MKTAKTYGTTGQDKGDNYKASVAEATWKSAKSKAGGITVATLFKQARDNGYRPEKPYVAPNPEQRALIARERATQDEIWAVYNHVRHQSAARLAHTIWRNAKALTAADLAHPYLQSKGIQDVTAVAGIRINRYKGQNKRGHPDLLAQRANRQHRAGQSATD